MKGEGVYAPAQSGRFYSPTLKKENGKYIYFLLRPINIKMLIHYI